MPAAEEENAEKERATASSELRTVTLPVLGMSCAACQSHVERALRSTAGVSDASVNLLTNSARVSFDPGVAKPQDLIASVREAGYDAELPAESPQPAAEKPGDESGLRARAIATLS